MEAPVNFDRPVYTQNDVETIAKQRKIAAFEPKKFLKSSFQSNRLLAFLRNRFPLFNWLPQYNVKRDLLSDLIAGITVGIMMIPQSMAYGTLAGLDAAHGLYTSFFPGLLYFIFGTSKHNSLGVFAVVSMMVSSVRFRLAPYELSDYLSANGSRLNASVVDSSASALSISPFRVVATLTFATGLFSLVLAISRAGFLSVLISDQVSAGFTTGAGVHVLSAQLDKFFGISHMKRHSGPGKLILVFIDFVKNLKNSHWPSIVMSTVSLALLSITKEVLNPLWIKRVRLGIPIPGDMILIILGTTLSYHLKLADRGMKVVGMIPSGFPEAMLPDLSLFSSIALDALVLSIVCYCVSMSLAQMTAKKFHYTINPDQELFALGAIQLFTSFFSCITPCAAMGRTMVLVGSGGRSQICSVIASLIVLLVIYWIGPLLQTLPECILAVIVICALKGIFRQFLGVPKLWKSSKLDFTIWMVSFLATVLFDIAYGLAFGVCFAFLSFGFQFIGKRLYELASFRGTDLYFNKQDYEELTDYDDILIVVWEAPLFYGNVKYFENQLYKKLNDSWSNCSNEDLSYAAVESFSAKSYDDRRRHLILDFSKVTLIDTSGIVALAEAVGRVSSSNAIFYMACCSGGVRRALVKSVMFAEALEKLNFFPSVHDAVRFAKANRLGDTDFA